MYDIETRDEDRRSRPICFFTKIIGSFMYGIHPKDDKRFEQLPIHFPRDGISQDELCIAWLNY